MASSPLQKTPSVPPGAKAPIAAYADWTDLEKWVWAQIQVGKVANIDRYPDGESTLPPADPKNPEDWRDGRRRLSARFLEMVLLEEPYRSAIHRSGVRIQAAWLEEEIDLRNSELHFPLWLVGSRFEGRMIFTDMRGRLVSFNGSHFVAKLELQRADIGANLFMEGGAEFQEISLSGAQVGGQVSLTSAKVFGRLDMDSADIGQSLSMRSDDSMSEQRAEFKEVILRHAKVGGQVSLVGTKVCGRLDMDSADIGQSLLMGSDERLSAQRSEFKEVILRGAKVGGQVSLVGAKVAGKLDMGSADIGQSLFMRSEGKSAEFDGGISLIFAKIGINLDVRGAALCSLDLTGTRVGGELMLASGSSSPQWQDGGRLVLRNASVDAIQDTAAEGVWAPDLELDGFTYKRFGGLGSGAEDSIADRDPQWFVDWLARDEPYTPHPYQQCANVLREMGHPEMANDVLYAGRERERKEAQKRGDYSRWAGLTLLKWTIGYGYGDRLLWRPLGWAALLLAIGIGVTYSGSPAFVDSSIWWRTLFSLDMLLPIVELSREHSNLQAGLDGVAYGWFAIQRLLGWVLALFLIAGLSGLTK